MPRNQRLFPSLGTTAMPLTAGSRLGCYEIVAPLGAGGMGEVYQARDLKLGRQVALKVIRDDLTQDAERLARFEREARLLAALNHPNVAALYGLDETDGTPFLVMELVPGQTLAQRLGDKPPHAAEALVLAGQIAAALEAAHDRGIIHRDLKPSNVKITPDGQVKVLDFGLARSLGVESDPARPTGLHLTTREGVVLGTPAYMSPEQVRGQPLDQRTDVWSFGCVLYEMLAGRMAFRGATAADLFAAILGQEPEWDALPADAPAAVRDLLRACLRKDRGRRFREVADARILLEEAADHPRGPAVTADDAPRQAPHPAGADTATLVGTRTDNPELDRLRQVVFRARLGEISFLLIGGMSPLLWFFLSVVLIVAWVVSVIMLKQSGSWAEGVGFLLLPLLLTGLGLWGLLHLEPRWRQRVIQRKIERLEKECPDEVRFWGGRSTLTDPIRVQWILQQLQPR